ncbi:MAG: acyl-CoA desaturase [Saprospiraceae bacterium]|nr:acyl-CoA desaturase [Saprospiraceae bacterium]
MSIFSKTTSDLGKIRFAKSSRDEFVTTLRKRVNAYFKENNISKHANLHMVIKTISILLIYFVPYGLILSGVTSNIWIHLALWAIMGFGMAGLGMSVMHDAVHGAYSKSPFWNKMLGSTIFFIGGAVSNWKLQHNEMHHSFTNIHGYDHDIDAGPILRISPHDKLFSFHRFQYIYAWGFYSLMTLYWATGKDFAQSFQYKAMGVIKSKERFRKLMFEVVTSKLFYFAYIVALPIIFAPVAWWVSVIGFIVMHMIAGLILSCVFQLAHVMNETEFPLPDDSGSIENSWAIHQLFTTVNFSKNSKIMSWFVGGLNYQIEHHLFPNICHVHYKDISDIVKRTAAEFGLPYHTEKNFVVALRNHASMLKSLGRA